ncbi:septum site-determining protein MinC [Picosynechococcus sp. NKBG042902]|uniref:septum site-determining protein MinC n=1 Tax=Picosynechococcus sp. NKBG042902 TaxID=490193 RepID=UPI0004AA2A63|nr:septum site-determining protein MinC [Picosynechococcus sp. NKBG042902]
MAELDDHTLPNPDSTSTEFSSNSSESATPEIVTERDDLNPKEPEAVMATPELQFGLEADHLTLVLPTTQTYEIEAWDTIWANFREQLQAAADFPVAHVHLIAQNQLVGGRQLQELADLLKPHDLKLKRIYTNRRQTAIAAATAGYSVDQDPPNQLLADVPLKLKPLLAPDKEPEVLYIDQTVRSGVEIVYPGSVIVTGDVNPGGSIVADKDIVVWGCLRGVAHAGAKGDRTGRIMALQMEPTQLRIADVVARAAPQAVEQRKPEVAYLTQEGIRLAPALKFSKNYQYQADQQHWQETSDPLLPVIS